MVVSLILLLLIYLFILPGLVPDPKLTIERAQVEADGTVHIEIFLRNWVGNYAISVDTIALAMDDVTSSVAYSVYPAPEMYSSESEDYFSFPRSRRIKLVLLPLAKLEIESEKHFTGKIHLMWGKRPIWMSRVFRRIVTLANKPTLRLPDDLKIESIPIEAASDMHDKDSRGK